MKFCRFQPLDLGPGPQPNSHEWQIHSEARWGAIEGGLVRELSAAPFAGLKPTGRDWRLEEIKLLPPVEPSKVVCLGRNYSEHAAELGNELPKEPLIFLKPPSSVIGPDEPIRMPAESARVDYEGELAVVIGRTCSRLGATEDVSGCIFGFTCLNDVTARDIQKREVQFTRAKGFDTFCPLGPVIETELDWRDTPLETYVNGLRKQFGRTSQMTFPVDAIIRAVSRVMTLVPGDVIATGTPSGVGPLAAGDVVEIVVGGVGTLRNPVARATE
ncbi:MAG: fumarylacetoacetate hydrolase family protein [Candidatus Acidiferrales bacterium]